MNAKRTCVSKNDKGFTIIEMIGVLAIIAILAAVITPRIFDAISDSRITGFVSTVKTVQTAVTKYYTDLGTLYAINAVTGIAAADNTGLLLPNLLTGVTPVPAAPAAGWLKYRGPYLDAFKNNNPPIGTSMIMPSVAAAGATTAAVAANNVTNYDLNNDGNNDFTAGSEIVSIQVNGASLKEFEKVDAILDEGIGATAAEKYVRGKVKWVAAGGQIRIYIATR